MKPLLLDMKKYRKSPMLLAEDMMRVSSPIPRDGRIAPMMNRML